MPANLEYALLWIPVAVLAYLLFTVAAGFALRGNIKTLLHPWDYLANSTNGLLWKVVVNVIPSFVRWGCLLLPVLMFIFWFANTPSVISADVWSRLQFPVLFLWAVTFIGTIGYVVHVIRDMPPFYGKGRTLEKIAYILNVL